MLAAWCKTQGCKRRVGPCESVLEGHVCVVFTESDDEWARNNESKPRVCRVLKNKPWYGGDMLRILVVGHTRRMDTTSKCPNVRLTNVNR